MSVKPPSNSHTTELAGLLGQVLEAHDAERCALAHRLQENTGQALAALMFQLRVLERHCTDAEQARRIAESRNVVIEALHDLESLLLTLYPPALEEQGLGPALEVYVQEFSRTAQIHIETDLEILPERLCSTVEIGLFRVAQDALEAICQHPMISWVQLLLRLRVGAIALIIQDDGPGFTLDELSGWNFVRMRRRAESLGADCSFSTSPEGSRIEIVVPLEFKASDSDKDLDR